jgi:S1-C subfamily serine protease
MPRYLKLISCCLFITLIGANWVHGRSKEYRLHGQVEADAKVYLSRYYPIFVRDSLFYDPDIITYIGNGKFDKKIWLSRNAIISEYYVVVENSKFGYGVYKAEKFYNPRKSTLNISIEEPTPGEFESLDFPLAVELNAELNNSRNVKTGELYFSKNKKFIPAGYMSGYTDNRVNSDETTEQSFATSMNFILAAMTNQQSGYEIIPDLKLSIDFENEKIKSSNYYSPVEIHLNLLLKAGDYVVSERLLTDIPRRILYNSEANFYWLFHQIRTFLSEVDVEALKVHFENEYKAVYDEWESIFKTNNQEEHKMTKAVVSVISDLGHGSGVIIKKSGFILTNYHVVAGTDTVTVSDYQGNLYEANVYRFNKALDVALLKSSIDYFEHEASINDNKILSNGAEVRAIGSPLSEKLAGSISQGNLTGTFQKDNNTYYITSATVNPGNSGGGLFDANGNLIGIINAKIVGYSNHNIGFAIPIKSVLEGLKIRIDENE